MKAYVTLQELDDFGPCKSGYKKLRRKIEFEDAEEVRIPLLLVLETNGMSDLYWLVSMLSLRNPSLVPGIEEAGSEIAGVMICELPGCSACTPEDRRAGLQEVRKILKKLRRD